MELTRIIVLLGSGDAKDMLRLSNVSVYLSGFGIGFLAVALALMYPSAKIKYVSRKHREHVQFTELGTTYVKQPDHQRITSNTTEARILCWIVTHPRNFKTRTMSVKLTWTKRCDIMLFFSSEYDPTFPTIVLDIPEGRDNLPEKVFKAMAYIYDKYYDQADWFLKADDDTYVILSNLRHFLKDKDPTAPYYYGQIFNGTYASGGAGYVLGKSALRSIASLRWKPDEDVAYIQRGYSEDLVIGRCLASLGINLWNNTNDSLGRPIFNWNAAYGPLNNKVPDWARKVTHTKTGPNSVSTIAASFHYVPFGYVLSVDFYLYNLTVYGYHRPEWPTTS